MTNLLGGSPIGGCLSLCYWYDMLIATTRSSTGGTILNYTSCNGIHCCQSTVPLYLEAFDTSYQKLFDFDTSYQKLLNDYDNRSDCNHAFLVDQDWFMSNSINVSPAGEILDSIPVVLEWNLYNYTDPDEYDLFYPYYYPYLAQRYCITSQSKMHPQNNITRCFCSQGFQGNPYLLRGCQDINECDIPNICGSGNTACFNHPGSYKCEKPSIFQTIVGYTGLGLLLLFIGAWLSWFIRRWKHKKRKGKFLKQNGGLLLQQQLSTGEDHVEKIKLFTSRELRKATNEFNVNRVLGHGSQGAVYKGMLEDGRIVAVKKSIIADGGEVGEFINEIGILSQINHRNVVKLLGCCLETEVPLLVYEFIPNGSLSQYIHHQNDFRLTWEMRLRVSMQVAGALSYFHSSTCLPIYHRDIKSGNILLDDKFNAKIADFGTSRSIIIDKTHFTTLVKGACGYLDPGYFNPTILRTRVTFIASEWSLLSS